MTTRRWWNGTPSSEPGFMHAPGNVAHMPRQTLDEMEHRLRAKEGELVGLEADMDRTAMKYNDVRAQYIAIREQMAERLKESGIKAEFVRTPPTLERLGGDDDEPVAR
jgi:hypothetical protein